MSDPTQKQAILDTIARLAEEIARASPESASKAMQIVDLVREFDTTADQATIQDVLDAEAVDTDFSDTHVRTTASAIAKALKKE